MNITVLGCGALGQLWLAALHKQAHSVQGWLRVPQSTCRTDIRYPDGTRCQLELPANRDDLLGDCELLLVTLKAWQVSTAVAHLAARLPTGSPVLLLHNGMGTADELRQIPQPLLMGITTIAARRVGHCVEQMASGITHIGPLSNSARPFSVLADVLHAALPDVAWHDNISTAAWRKLAANCAINPLTALHNCANGGLRDYPEVIARVVDEVAEVMAREGHHASADDLLAWVWQVIDTTSANTSSMLQDVRAQRHTEIDYITGFLLRRARAHGIATPENARLFADIKCKEKEYERHSPGLPRPW